MQYLCSIYMVFIWLTCLFRVDRGCEPQLGQTKIYEIDICCITRSRTALMSKKAASDNVYQLLAHSRWFSPGTPASSTTETGRHDKAEILLKVVLNTINQLINQSLRSKSKVWLARHQDNVSK